MPAHRAFLAVAALAAFAALPDLASADTFPTRPITVVVPFPAGGPLDVLTRVMGDRMHRSLGQPLVIENVGGGAGGTIGVGRVARAAADGYTLGIGFLGTHALNSAIFRLQYDLLTDFEPVAMLPSAQLLIAGKQSLPVDSLKDLVSWLKANAQKANIATPGVGSPSHVMGAHLQKVVDAPLRFVHYRGGGPALQDLVGGHVDLFVNQPSILLPQLREGKIKVFAVLGPGRLPQAPNIPTSAEQGFADLQMSVWHGLWAPKSTPKAVIESINKAVRETLNDAAVRDRLSDLGYDLPPVHNQTPAALADLQRAEIEKWSPIIKAAGIKSE
jgi:tripartite-type tricarboxylate transporter receptor subunit TctC